jgi:hypothetical protein
MVWTRYKILKDKARTEKIIVFLKDSYVIIDVVYLYEANGCIVRRKGDKGDDCAKHH